MNKNILIGITLATCFTACSTENGTDTASNSALMINNSDKVINLQSESVMFQTDTRALVNDASGVFAADNIGLFCLATAQLANGRDYPINWTDYNSDNTVPGTYSVWFQNVMINAKSAIDDYNNPHTKFTWVDGKSRYYPSGNGHAYSFYALWPAPQDLQFSKNAITSYVNLADGEMDVLWGECDKQSNSPTGTNTLAYCAKYFRQVGKTTEIPMLTFYHKLMAFQFAAVAGADADGSTAAAEKLKITAIRVNKVPKEGRIYIASNDGEHQAGSIVCDWNNTTKLATINVEDTTGVHKLTKNHWIPTTTTNIGQRLVVPVPPSNDYYTISVDLADANGNVYNNAISWPLTLKNGYNYEAGHTYQVKFLIYGLSNMHLQAKMSSWIEDQQTFVDPSSK